MIAAAVLVPVVVALAVLVNVLGRSGDGEGHDQRHEDDGRDQRDPAEWVPLAALVAQDAALRC